MGPQARRTFLCVSAMMEGMHRLSYAGETVFVADNVCRALMDYASALAAASIADVVSIPVIDEAGLLTDAEVLVGPASQLFAARVEHMREEAEDAAVVEELQKRTEKVLSEAS